ncbi:MAG: tRNA lysidine(34) synthetase TilS [Nitrospinae bacterium]|nr:tRNA lysidine(34) synthetase TilS [Nitrospinota bacterium]
MEKSRLDPFVSTALRVIKKHGMVKPGQRVCVALSGGPDSVALLHVLAGLAGALDIALKACHYDHALRPSSVDDAAFARNLAAEMSMPFAAERNQSPKPYKAIQDTARKWRYGFFERLVDEGFADVIATGHTKDDNVETALMRLLRGAGPGAFGGIPPARGRFIRPLIETRKGEILDWLAINGHKCVQDPTNEGDDYLRNRVRHHLVPALLSVEPSAVEAISRFMGIVKSQNEVIESIAAEKLQRVILRKKDPVTLDAGALSLEPEAVRNCVIRLAASMAGLDITQLAITHVEAVAHLVMSRKLGSYTSLPGDYQARLDHGGLHIAPKSAKPAMGPIPFTFPLIAEVSGKPLLVRSPAGPEAAQVINPPAVPEGAVFRLRMTGDYLRLPNTTGRKTLKTFLIDRKVPLSEREQMPVLAVGSQILWVPGNFMAAEVKFTGAGSPAEICWG